MLNTLNSKTCQEALESIITNVKKSMIYKPIAYYLKKSECIFNCYEKFNIIFKINNDYRIYEYWSHLTHTNENITSCHDFCPCEKYFDWKNIELMEINYPYNNLDFENNFAFEDTLKYTSIDVNLWHDDFLNYFKQSNENLQIQIYTYDQDKNEDKDKQNIVPKNFKYYFS